MLVAPGPGAPLQLTVKLTFVVVAGRGLTPLVGSPARYVWDWAAAGPDWTDPTLLVDTEENP
jgi:hypothetical protein